MTDLFNEYGDSRNARENGLAATLSWAARAMADFLATNEEEVEEAKVMKGPSGLPLTRVGWYVRTKRPVPTPPPEPPTVIHHAGEHYRRFADWHSNHCACPVVIDPADPDQIRNAGLCRVDEVAKWLRVAETTYWIPNAFLQRFGGGTDD